MNGSMIVHTVRTTRLQRMIAANGPRTFLICTCCLRIERTLLSLHCNVRASGTKRISQYAVHCIFRTMALLTSWEKSAQNIVK